MKEAFYLIFKLRNNKYINLNEHNVQEINFVWGFRVFEKQKGSFIVHINISLFILSYPLHHKIFKGVLFTFMYCEQLFGRNKNVAV